MANLSSFYKENIIEPKKDFEFPLSERFIERDENGEPVLDENGKPVLLKFKMRTLRPEAFMNLSQGMIDVRADRGGQAIKMKEGGISNTSIALVVECLIEPDLRNAALQDSYGVTSVNDLFNAMFEVDEAADLISKANAIHQGNISQQDMVDQVKN